MLTFFPVSVETLVFLFCLVQPSLLEAKIRKALCLLLASDTDEKGHMPLLKLSFVLVCFAVCWGETIIRVGGVSILSLLWSVFCVG